MAEPEQNFKNNQVLTHTPVQFSVAFVARMRGLASLSHVPSLRTTLAIPRFLSARYFRQLELSPKDYIDAAVLNTPYEDQETAHRIARDILFPPQKKKKKQAKSDDGSQEQVGVQGGVLAGGPGLFEPRRRPA